MLLCDERLRLQQEAREFAGTVLPEANRLDPERAEVPEWIVQGLAERGYFGILIPKELGGLGLGAVEYCLVSEELARAWMSVSSVITYANGLTSGMTGERRDDCWRRMARGELLIAFALTEPGAGSDAANVECRATRTDDGWELNGRKRWCGYARNADAIIVYARTADAPETGRHRGISAFLVEKQRGEFPPGIVGRAIPKIGFHGITSWELDFEGLRLPESALVGELGGAFRVGMQEMNIGRLHTAARSIGCAQGALDACIAYARERTQFGRTLDQFQAIRFRIAEMATRIEAARALMYHAAEKLDTGDQAIAEAAMAKLFASEASEWVTSEALQIFGGNGYTTEHPAERYWRDARVTRIVEGTSEIQKHIVSRTLLGSGAR